MSAQITQFERDASGVVQLVAHWQVLPGPGGQPLRVGRSRIREQPRDDDYSAAVEAMSAAIAAMSAEISQSIQELEQTSRPRL